MVLELVAGRMVAAYVGVSLYTWTTIIGVILAGMSLGNYIGGRRADRRASYGLLSLFLPGRPLEHRRRSSTRLAPHCPIRGRSS